MSRFKDSAIALIIMFVLLLYGIFASRTIAWENQKTHPAITKEAIERSVLAGDYLKTQLGSNYDLSTPLELTGQFQNNIDMRIAQEPEFAWDSQTKVPIKEWLKKGSSLEDVPNPRARHHFYDPIRNTGLNNSDADPKVLGGLWLGSKWFYPDYWGFNATGLSDLDRAKGLDGDWVNEYLNYYNWIYARGLFYAGLTEQSKYIREAYLGSTFVTLGHICHLIEDMGVPAHTRNDFVWGHLVAGFYKDLTAAQKPWFKGGHPFEAWMETQIQNNGGKIPGEYLARLMDTPPTFDRFSKYWDSGICEPTGVAQWQGDSPGWPATGFGNPPPEKSWGLAECTNYQFLSYSTIFRSSLAVQYYPHPAKEHTRVDWYASGPDGAKQYYRIGYEVPHLARSTYTAYLLGDFAVWNTDTTEEKRVYEDYAKRTIPRTIDYTTGLLNYFFRGKLSIEQTDCNNGKIVITITNKSSNSGVSQVLKGGTFSLYWDDSAGNRTPVSDFTVYRPGTEPGAGNEWNSGTQMNYDESTKAVITPPESPDVNQYILVYEGIISANPDSPDLDDTRQIATAIKKLCGTCCPISCSFITSNGYIWLDDCSQKCRCDVLSGFSCCAINRIDTGIIDFITPFAYPDYTSPYDVYHILGFDTSCNLIKDFIYEEMVFILYHTSWQPMIESDGFGNIIYIRTIAINENIEYTKKISKISPADGSSLWDLIITPKNEGIIRQISVSSIAIYTVIGTSIYMITHDGGYSLVNWGENAYAYSVHQDQYGNLWIGGQRGSYSTIYEVGLFKNGVLFKGHSYPPGEGSYFTVSSITTDNYGYVYIGTEPACQINDDICGNWEDYCGGNDCSTFWKLNASTGQIIWKRALWQTDCEELSGLCPNRLRYANDRIIACYGEADEPTAVLFDVNGNELCEYDATADAQFVFTRKIWSTECSASAIICEPPDPPKKRGQVQWHIGIDSGNASGAIVAYTYNGAISGNGFATTDDSGIAIGFTPCTDATGPVIFTITGISKSGYNYDASWNECNSAICIY